MHRPRFALALIAAACVWVNVARSQEAAEAEAAETDSVALLQTAMRERISIGHNHDGQPVLARHCRNANGGCDQRLAEFAKYIVDAGQSFGIDPWLMAAMAFKESGLNPFAKGAMGELGILQIHPKRRDARQVRFIRDEFYRLRCHKEAGACQREVVRHAAQVLSRSLTMCNGDMAQALGAYNTGRCGGNRTYSKSVLNERGEMRRVAGLEHEQAAVTPPKAHPKRS